MAKAMTALRRGFWTMAAVLVVISGTAAAAPRGNDGPSDADRQVLQTYKLSMDKLRHFAAGDKALYADAARDPALKAEIAKMADEEPQKSLGDLQAKLQRHPRVAAYYTKEGITAQEAVVIPLATMEAMGAVETKGAGDASPDQIEFVKQHKAEIQTLLDQWFKEDGED